MVPEKSFLLGFGVTTLTFVALVLVFVGLWAISEVWKRIADWWSRIVRDFPPRLQPLVKGFMAIRQFFGKPAAFMPTIFVGLLALALLLHIPVPFIAGVVAGGVATGLSLSAFMLWVTREEKGPDRSVRDILTVFPAIVVGLCMFFLDFFSLLEALK